MSNTTTTILQQLLHLLPRNDFRNFVGQHNADKYTKKLSCWNQLTIMIYAQATEKDSLREIETGLRIQDSRWYHLGLNTCARSTLSAANSKRPCSIYESLFYKVLERCQKLGSGTASFSFRNDLYAIDASVIDLCLNLFPWAKFRKEKGAIKLHALFNIRSQIPELIQITNGKTSDITAIRDIDFSKYAKGSIFVFDKAYTDYSFFRKIKKVGHHFVIRLKDNANIVHLGQHKKALGKGVLKDEKIAFILEKAQKDYPDDLRLVTFHDKEYDVIYEFITDEFKLSATNIAQIYKRRWDVELFFKWIKQHLKIKTFLGTSKNAVMTQIWIAMIYYLLLAWIGGVYTDGKQTSTGVRESWVKMGSLTTPGFTYGIESGGYGNFEKVRGERREYVDMFDNYLSKIPVIQSYLSWVKANDYRRLNGNVRLGKFITLMF